MIKIEGSEQTRHAEEATTSKQLDEQYQRQISENAVTENIQKQLDELLVIQSIFDESILTIDTEKRCGRFIAYPNIIASPYHIIFCTNGKNDLKKPSNVHGDIQKMEIEYLPRIEFTFALDNYYPNQDPPAFLLSCQWLSSLNITKICEQLDKLYDESRSEILYSWFTFLRDDVLAFLNSEQELDVSWLLNNYCDAATNINYNKSYSPSKYRGHGLHDERVVLNESTPNLLRTLRGE